MDLIFRWMAPVGIGLVLFVVPTLALTTLVLSAISDKAKGVGINLCIFLGYLILFVVSVVCILNCSIVRNIPGWIPFLECCLLCGSIPHSVILIRALHQKNRRRIWVGIFGISTTLLATIGIGLACYSARFF